MNKTLAIKMTLDLVMTILLILMFAYQLTGNLAHEVMGVIIFTLFVSHNVMNYRWYKNLLKGKYGFRRIVTTAVNFLLLVAMSVQAVTGIMISRDIFAFIGFGGGFDARTIHTTFSFWGLILIGVHLGLHWSMILGVFQKMSGKIGRSPVRTNMLRLVSVAIAAFGVKSSFDLDIGSKLFMQSTFSYWDFENAALLFFLAYISVMGLYIIITYYGLKLSQKTSREENIK